MRVRPMPSWVQQRWSGLGIVGGLLVVLTAATAPFLDDRHVLAVTLVYLLVSLLAAAIWGYVVGLAAAIASELLVNFFFVPPIHTFSVQDPRQGVELLLFLAVTTVGAAMLALLRRQATLARSREAEANTVLGLSHAQALAVTPTEALERLCAFIAGAVGADGCAVLRDAGGLVVVVSTPDAVSRAAPTRTEEALFVEAQRRQTAIGLGGRGRLLARLTGRSETPRFMLVPFPPTAPERGALRIAGTVTAPPLVDPSRLLSAFAAEASTALHQVELTEAARQAEALRRADEFKSILLSSVSHDLRSPLTAIKAAVGSLRDPQTRWEAEDIDDFLGTIESQTDRLIATVTDLLQMSRLESGTVTVAREPIRAIELLRDAVSAAATETVGRAVSIEADESLWIAADHGLLMQALGNIVENAARYSVAGGRIRLSARATGDRVRITVIDDGPGIPSEDLPHVFEKFYRGGQTGQSKGTGLGLAIVRTMVELCGGAVGVESSAAGTEFWLLLPATEEPE